MSEYPYLDDLDQIIEDMCLDVSDPYELGVLRCLQDVIEFKRGNREDWPIPAEYVDGAS